MLHLATYVQPFKPLLKWIDRLYSVCLCLLGCTVSTTYTNTKATPTNDTNYSYYIRCKTCLTRVHIMPLVIHSHEGENTHTYTHTHTHTQTHTYQCCGQRNQLHISQRLACALFKNVTTWSIHPSVTRFWKTENRNSNHTWNNRSRY